MRKLLSKLWADDDGFIVSIELLFIAVILVIGLIAGWANLRVAIVTEFTTLANAVLALNPGFQIDEVEGNTGGSQGSGAITGGELGTAPRPQFTWAGSATPTGLKYEQPINSDIGSSGVLPDLQP